MYSYLDRRYPVRFAAVYYQIGNLPVVDRGLRTVCTSGSHKRQNEIRKKKLYSTKAPKSYRTKAQKS